MNQQLLIGYDAKRIVSNATGLGSYGRTLVNDLAASGEFALRLYAPTAGREDLRSQVVACDNVSFAYPEGRKLGLQRSLWRSRGIVGDLKRDGVALYHGLSGELPVGISKSGIRSVVTIHDLIFLRHPEYYNWVDTKIYAWKFRQACHEADRIIAISECTKRDIMELGGVSVDRIELIYQSCSPRFSADVSNDERARVAHAYQLPRRYLLSVGSIEQRKNIQLAVNALKSLPDDIHLVAVGKSTPYAERVLAQAGREQLSHRVHFLHGVPDGDLPAIYAQAEVFVYPSRYEGFGIPVIEAIHCRLPVIACTGSCLEEAGGPDCLYVSPDDPNALAAAFRQLQPGAAGREERISRSRDYVRRFEGNDVAGQVAALYRQLTDK